MPAEYIIRYLGDETTELVEGQKPHRQELNNIVKQVTERCDSDNRKELIRNFFDFMVDPATEGTRKKYAEYKRAEAIKKPVLVKGEDGEYVRRFPVVLSKEGKVEYKQKRVGYAGVIFNYTGKNLPNGDPEYTTRWLYRVWWGYRVLYTFQLIYCTFRCLYWLSPRYSFTCLL